MEKDQALKVSLDPVCLIDPLQKIEAAGLLPSQAFIDTLRLAICKDLIVKAPENKSQWLNKSAAIFLSYFKPRRFERNRHFNPKHFKTLRLIKDIELWKSTDFSAQLLQLYDVPLKRKSLADAFNDARFTIRPPDRVDDDKYRRFRQRVFSDFRKQYESLTDKDKGRPREFRTLENLYREKEPQLFSWLCLEALIFKGTVDRLALRETYRSLRPRIGDKDARRAWLLALLPLPSFGYRSLLYSPIAISFFRSDKEIASLAIKVLVQKENRGNSLRLEKLWRSFLNLYPLYLNLLDEEIEIGIRGKHGDRRTYILRPKYSPAPIAAMKEAGGCLSLEPYLGHETSGPQISVDAGKREIKLMNYLISMCRLTKKEAERYWANIVDNESHRSLARQEGVDKKAVALSLQSCERKIRAAVRDGKIASGDIKSIVDDCIDHDSMKCGEITLYKHRDPGGTDDQAD